jgi:hypothetical protein
MPVAAVEEVNIVDELRLFKEEILTELRATITKEIDQQWELHLSNSVQHHAPHVVAISEPVVDVVDVHETISVTGTGHETTTVKETVTSFKDSTIVDATHHEEAKGAIA